MVPVLSLESNPTDFRRWIKNLHATLLPLKEDKNCAILIAMRSLQLYSNLFPSADDQISILLDGSYRAVIRKVATEQYGKQYIDSIMESYDYLQASKDPDATVLSTPGMSTRASAAKALAASTQIEDATKEQAAQAAAAAALTAQKLDYVLALADAGINMHCVATLSKHLDPGLLATVCEERTIMSLLSKLKAQFASDRVRKTQLDLFEYLLKSTRLVHTASDYYLLLKDAGVVLTAEEEQQAIVTLRKSLAARTPFRICVTLQEMKAISKPDSSTTTEVRLPDFIAKVHALEKENDKILQQADQKSAFPSGRTSECAFKLTGENPFDNEVLLNSESFDLNLVLGNRRRPAPDAASAKGQEQPFKRGAGGSSSGPAVAASPPGVSDTTGATFHSGDGKQRCTLCTSLSCAGATVCSGIFDHNHMGAPRRAALELLPQASISAAKARAAVARSAQGQQPQSGHISQSSFFNEDGPGFASGEMYSSLSRLKLLLSRTSQTAASMQPPQDLMPVPLLQISTSQDLMPVLPPPGTSSSQDLMPASRLPSRDLMPVTLHSKLQRNSLCAEAPAFLPVSSQAHTSSRRTYAAAAAAATVSQSEASDSAVFDSGCGPAHCLSPADPCAVLSDATDSTTHLVSATGSSVLKTQTGTGTIKTVCSNGCIYNLRLPGKSVTSAAFPRTLVSASTMLQNDHRLHIGADGRSGTVSTPDGIEVPLVVKDGLYTFPLPPVLPTSNMYDALPRQQTLASSSVDVPSPESSPLCGSTSLLPSEAVLRDFDLLDSLHRAHNFPGQARMRNLVHNMHRDDPARPNPSSIPAWLELSSCKPYRAMFSNDDVPTSLQREFNLLDQLHASHGHPGQARMRLLLLALSRDDPDADIPDISSIPAWLRSRPCAACKLGGGVRPPLRATHPPLPAASATDAGCDISIDGSGAYPHPTIDGNVQSFFVVDRATHVRWAFPTKSKDNDTLLDTVLLFQAHSTVKLRSLRVDAELIGPPLRQYCLEHGIKLTSCAPNTHSGNGIAERAVGLIKTASRVCTKHACISTMLLDHAHICAAQQLSIAPSSSPIFGRIQSPASAWLFATGSPAPFLHNTLEQAPFGCLVYGHVGKVSSAPNTDDRTRPGVFLNHDPLSTSYRVFHSDRKKVMSYAHVTIVPTRFPYCEQYFAGERPGTQDTADLLAWRQHSIYPLTKVDDEALANFVVGKQVHVSLHDLYPEYPHPWRAICQGIYRPQHKSLTEVTAMRLVFSGYSGPLSSLSKADRNTATALAKHSAAITPLEIIVPVSALKAGQTLPADDGRDHWYRPPRGSAIRPPNLRDLLKRNYPTARSLADVAYASSNLLPYYPVHDALLPPTVSPDKTAEPVTLGTPSTGITPKTPPSTSAKRTRKSGTRVIVPSRKVANTRSARATWSPPSSNIIPNRTLCRKAAAVNPTSGTAPETNARRTSPRRQTPQAVFIVQQASTGTHLGWEPTSVAAAKKHSSWPLWEAAIDKEIAGLIARGTWTVVDISDVPRGIRILPTKIVLKDKYLTGPKARLVVRGDLEDDRPASDTYSATPAAAEIRTVFALATQNGWKIHSLDVSQAFTQSDPLGSDEEIYIKPPAGYDCPPGTVWKLNRPLYGLSIAPKCWTTTLQRFLADYGFTKVNCSETFWKWSSPCGKHHIQIVYWVDDILLSFNNDDAAAAFKSAFLSRFDGTDDGPVHRFVGIDVTRSATQTHLSQEPLARELLEKFGMSQCNAVLTPLEPGVLLLESDRPAVPDPELRRNYQVIVGTLQYLCTYTRPDLVFATNQLAKHMSNPGPVHMQHARRVLRYLKGTASLGITYTQDRPNPNGLLAWADADWCSCTETRRSYSGYCLMLNGGALSWKSAQQTAVCTSTMEAEWVSASRCADEVLWLRRVLADVGHEQKSPTPLMEDNRACRALSECPITARSRHIDYRVMSLRERVADGVVKVFDCPTHDMLADPLTKNLPHPSFVRHRQVMLGQDPATSPFIQISG